jgi:hypothetical protein
LLKINAKTQKQVDLAKTREKSLESHARGGCGNGLEKEQYMPYCNVKDTTEKAWFRYEI